jgi:death-on-curing protein
MKKEPLWVDEVMALAFHEAVLAAHGGLAGVRDHGLLLSALARAQHLWQYEKADLFDLAASYAFGIARNHPFLDGNKRAAFLKATAFLEINDYRFTASEVDATLQMFALAAGEKDEGQIAAWLKANCKPAK